LILNIILFFYNFYNNFIFFILSKSIKDLFFYNFYNIIFKSINTLLNFKFFYNLINNFFLNLKFIINFIINIIYFNLLSLKIFYYFIIKN